MPLTINVGLSRKASENFQSQGVSIKVSAELDQSLLADPRRLQHEITGLYEQAEIALEHQSNTRNPKVGRIGRVGHHQERPSENHTNGQRNGNQRAATGSQLRALHAIADRLDLDLEDETQHVFNCRPKELDVRQASQMIDDLKALQIGDAEPQSTGSRRGGRR